MANSWITTAEAAEITGYNTEYLRALIRAGNIKAQKKGNSWWVDRRSILAYLRQAEKATDRRYRPKKRRTA